MKGLSLIVGAMTMSIALLAEPQPQILSALNTEDFYLSQEQPANFTDNPFLKDIKEVDLASLKLLGVVHSPNNSAALINRQIVRVNDQIGKAKVIAIEPHLVVLGNDSGIYKLMFEGQSE